MRRFVALVAVLTCSLTATAAPPAPAEGIDDLMLYLLDDERIRAELAMEPAQASMLDLFRAEYTKQRRAVAQRRAKAPAAEHARLDQELKDMQGTLRRDLGRVLTPDQLARLKQVKLQALGARAAFGSELHAALQITPKQREQFLHALIRYEDALYAEYRQLVGEKNEEAVRGRLLTLHQRERRRLDETVVAEVLDAAQRCRLAEAQGAPVAFAVDAVRPESLLNNLKQRAQRPVPRYRQPYPLDVLVRLPEVHRLLQTTAGENERLAKCADKWDQAQDRVHASLQHLNPRIQERRMWEWRQAYTADLPALEAKLGDILGPERLRRLQEIRRQVCGPQMLLQLEPLPGQELTASQKDRFEKHRQQLAGELQKKIASALQASRAGADLAPLYEAHIRATDEAVLAALTPGQREAWQMLRGEPVSEITRKSLRKSSVDLVGHASVRRG